MVGRIQKTVWLFLCMSILCSLLSAGAYAQDQPVDALEPAEPVSLAEMSQLQEESLSTLEEDAETEDIGTEDGGVAELSAGDPEEDWEETASDAEESVQTDGATQVNSVTIWDGQEEGAVPIQLEYTEYYSKAFEVLECINDARADYGLYPLQMDVTLMEASMLRAAETSIWWAHTRPNGEKFSTVNTIGMVEIIAKVYPTPKQAVNGWLNSSDHRSVVLTQYYTHIGVGCINIGGNWFWTALGSTKYYELASESNYSDQQVSRVVYSNSDILDGRITVSVKGSLDGMYPGDTAQLQAKYYNTNYDYSFSLPISGFTMYSTDLSVCTVDANGLITGTGPGSASVVVYYPEYVEDATVFAVTGRGSTTVTVTAMNALSDITARVYSTDVSDASIRADMLKSTSSLALYQGNAGASGTVVDITFRDVSYGEYKLAVYAAGGYVILVDELTVEGDYTIPVYEMWQYGDLDYNGVVDSADALETFNHSCGLASILDSTPNAGQDTMRRLAADVNRDGVINIRDATQILRYTNELTSCFEVIP